ncbi:hypothetical protein [Acidisphaera sp. L21]|uniref:hypothetical protein n=1 Tax=Acidisphaera sp. L21 TaxID=1641851 RepID=UPI0015774727
MLRSQISRGQHPLRDVRETSPDFVELQCAVKQMEQDDALLLAVDELQRRLNSATWRTIEPHMAGCGHRGILSDTMGDLWAFLR